MANQNDDRDLLSRLNALKKSTIELDDTKCAYSTSELEPLE
jgi:hypothetical protein